MADTLPVLRDGRLHAIDLTELDGRVRALCMDECEKALKWLSGPNPARTHGDVICDIMTAISLVHDVELAREFEATARKLVESVAEMDKAAESLRKALEKQGNL